MKTGVSSYSFYQYVKDGRMDCEDVLCKAKEIGFDGVEFVDFNLQRDNALEYAAKLKKKAEELGIEICCYSFGADLIKETDEECSRELERVKREIDIAAALGAKLIRHDTMFKLKRFRSFDLCIPFIARQCREISKYAEQYGIRTTVENHGTICQGSERVERLFNAVDYPNFGLLVDIGNFLCADEEPAHAVSVTAPYAFHAHIKDFKVYKHGEREVPEGHFESRACNALVGKPAGYGDVPVAQCIDILKKTGYDGYLVLEYEGAEDCICGIQKGFDFIKSVM